MGYSKQDWLRDRGALPGIDLDAIRFGRRAEPRKPLQVPYLGQPVEGKPLKKRRDDDPGYEKFQLRLW
jgi:hypothetical protein